MSQPLVFLGPPASGKGTQAQRLAESLGFSYLSTGGLLRRALRDDTELGKKSRPFLPMVLEWVSGKQGQWILDGFPRTLNQAKALDSILTETGKKLPQAIVLEVPDKELRFRVTSRIECEACHWTTSGQEQPICPKCGGKLVTRADDSSAKFESRLLQFRKQVVPAIRYYRENERGMIINAVGSPDEIHRHVGEALSLF